MITLIKVTYLATGVISVTLLLFKRLTC